MACWSWKSACPGGVWTDLWWVFPIVISGDHSTAYGTIAGISRRYIPKTHRCGFGLMPCRYPHTLYTTPTGNMHGMTPAMACDLDNLECKVNDPKGETIEYWEQMMNGVQWVQKFTQKILCTFSVRDYEKPENHLINKYGISFIENGRGLRNQERSCGWKTLKLLDHCDLIYVLFDVDSIDSRFSTGTGTPVPNNGLTFEEAKRWTQRRQKHESLLLGNCRSKPTLDTENRMAEGGFGILKLLKGAILESRNKTHYSFCTYFFSGFECLTNPHWYGHFSFS